MERAVVVRYPIERGQSHQYLEFRRTNKPKMALVAPLRGVNVGGHRTFRPSILARELGDYDVVNVGAAGTFVVRKTGSSIQVSYCTALVLNAEVLFSSSGKNLRKQRDGTRSSGQCSPARDQGAAVG